MRLAVPAALGVLAVVFLSATRAGNPPSGSGRRSFPPRVVAGDEPHYLLATSAILHGELTSVRPAYARVRAGGRDAGLRFAGVVLDHHTLIVAPGQAGPVFWRDAYQWWKPRDCVTPECTPFIPAGPDHDDVPGVREVPSHPLAFPLLIAALVAPFTRDPDRVEWLAITWNAVLAWLATLAVYGAARGAGFPRGRALAAAVVCGIASPLLAYGRGFFSDAATACALAVAAWLFFRGRLELSGVACALAFALKPPFVLAGASLIADRLVARRWREALRLGIPLAVGVALVLGATQLLAGTPLISGTNRWTFAHGLGSLANTLFGRTAGLLPFAPWAAFALVAAVRGTLAPPTPGAAPTPGRALGPGVLGYLLLLGLRADDAGDGWGPRYWVAWLPWLALLAVDLAGRGGRWRRVLLAVLVAWAIPISLAGAFRYPSVWMRTPWETVRTQWRWLPG